MHLNKRLNILAKKELPVGYDGIVCSVGSGGEFDNSTPNSKSTSITACSSPPVPDTIRCEEKVPACYASSKLLILVSEESMDYIGSSDVELYLTNLIERTNLALQRSETNVTVYYDFVEDFDWDKKDEIFVGVDTDSFAVNNEAQLLRDQYNADLVVLLTYPYNNNNNGEGGAVAEIGIDCNNAYAIVVPQKTGYPNYVFPHEIGHLFGGHHDGFDSGFGGHCAKGYRIKDNNNILLRNTLMVNDADNIKILNYSNPDVTYNGYPTGRYRDEDNILDSINMEGTTHIANRINQTNCTIADYNADIDLSVRISGSATICNNSQPYTAHVFSSSSGYSYDWSYSFDGVNTTPLSGTSATIDLTPPLNVASCQTFFLHAKVTDNNGVEGKYAKRIRRLNGSCEECQIPSLENDSEKLLQIVREEVNSNISIHPNPSTGNIQLRWIISTESNIFIELYELTGQLLVRENHILYKGLNTLDFNFSLPNGIYYLKGSTNQQDFNYPVIIQK